MWTQRTPLFLEQLEDRCTPASYGNPWPDAAHLTLSFAPDNTVIDGHASNLFGALNAVVPTATWELEVLRAFQTWAVNANINISVVTDDGLPFGTTGAIQGDSRFGDIRVGAFAMPPGAEAESAPFEVDAGTLAGDVMFNSAANFGVNGSGQYDLFTVALHEAGHVFGLPEDTTNPNSVMYENYLGPRTGLSAYDVANLQAIYGPRTPDQDTGATTRLNPLTNTSGAVAATVNADIATLQDRDMFSFTPLLAIGAVDIQVRTAGISQLAPEATVYNGFGQTVATAIATDPLGGGFTIHLNGVLPLSTYYVEIESGRQDVFGIGSYQLTVNYLPLVNSLLTPMTATVTQGLNTVSNALIDNGPDTNNSFMTAAYLPQSSATAAHVDYATRASIGRSSDVDYYQLQAPTVTAGSNDVLTVMAWGVESNGLNPTVRVFDAQHNLVAADVLVNDGFTYAIQIENPQTQATYYVEVLPNNPNGTNSVGNYFLGVDFSAHAIELDNYATSTLTASNPASSSSLTLVDSQLFHFVLSASTPSSTTAATVRMDITNSAGQVVFSMTGGTNEPVSRNVFLTPGTYSVLFSAATATGTALPTLTFLLRGITLIDPTGPEPADPNSAPVNSPPPSPDQTYTWSDGSNSGVPPQPPSSDPYSASSSPDGTTNSSYPPPPPNGQNPPPPNGQDPTPPDDSTSASSSPPPTSDQTPTATT